MRTLKFHVKQREECILLPTFVLIALSLVSFNVTLPCPGQCETAESNNLFLIPSMNFGPHSNCPILELHTPQLKSSKK